MSTARQMRESFEKLQSGMIEIAGEAMMEHKEEITGLLIHQQFEENVDSEGNPLREYSPRYRLEKQKQTGRGDKTDFNLSGEFQEEMNMRVEGDQYFFNSPAMTDTGELKSEWLNKWNRGEIKGKSLFGGNSGDVMLLTADNTALIYPIIEETFKEFCNERLALD